MQNLKAIAICAFLIALYYFTYYFYQGILNPIPLPGDSFDYHIPIEKSILNGSFFTATSFKWYQWYYPGSSEAINSIFIFLRIPLTLSNLLAAIILFFVCLKLGLLFLKNKYNSLLFASTIISLTAIVRWLNAVSIDIWTAVFFLLTLIFAEKPQKTVVYYLKLGFVVGMLIGSKYSAILYLIPLIIIFGKDIISKINLTRFIAFLIPFSIFGLFWYIRNFLLKGNPFYPLGFFGFKGHVLFIGNVFNTSIYYPMQMLNAFFGEYKLWILAIFFAAALLVYKAYKRQFKLDSSTKLFTIGFFNFLIYLTFPTSYQPWIMVSSLRYSYPFFIPLILGVYLLFQNYKKQDLLGFFAIANMLPVLSMVFYPKLVLVLLPAAVIFFYFFEKYKFKQ